MAKISSHPGTSRRGKLLVAALLTPAVVLPLCVPLYGREDPTLIGFPFFIWFQFALIAAAAGLTFSAHLIARSVDRRDRVAHGLKPEPDGSVAPDRGVTRDD
jgi:hypothetical protein